MKLQLEQSGKRIARLILNEISKKREYIMNLLKKTAICLAASSMLVAPVAASATQAVEAARAVSTVDGENELEGSSGWIIMALAAVGIIVAIVVLTGDDDDSPTSP